MRTKQHLVFVALVALVAGAGLTPACGAASGLTTSAPAESQLGELSGSALDDFCRDVTSYMDGWSQGSALEQGRCRYAAAVSAGLDGDTTDGALRDDCARRYASCMEVGPGSIPAKPRCAFPASCTATVGQYTACLTDITAALDQLATDAPACADLSVENSVTLPHFTLPASCKTYNALCPATPIAPTSGSVAGVFELHT